MTEPSRRLRLALFAAGILVTPVLHGLAFPLARRPALAWIAFVPWFVAIRVARPRSALGLSAVITLIGTYLVAGWLPRAVATYYGQPVLLGILLFVAAWTVTLAPWFLAFTACYRALARRAALLLPLLVAAAWVAGEYARVRLGNPFALLGYSQAPVGPVVQIADLAGVYGVSFAVVAVNAALAELVLVLLGARRRARAALAGAGAAAGLLALVLGYGLLASRLRAAGGAPATRVAIAQANLDLGAQWRQEFYGRNLEEYMRLSVEALRASAPALLVWPESAMTFFLESEPLYQRALGVMLGPGRTQLLAGGPRKSEDDDPRYYNSAFVIRSDGAIVARYDKERLLPFAEYFPLGGIELLRREFGRVREFTPGDAVAPLPTVAGPAGIVICNEAMFPELVARRVRTGAAYLVNLSNDSWLGDAQFSAQALDMAQLRAVEQRRWIVRASTSGPSALIDPLGRVVAVTAPFSRASLAGTVAAEAGLTPYARVGDLFALGCVLAVLVALLRRAAPRRPPGSRSGPAAG